jgi:aspartokinase
MILAPKAIVGAAMLFTLCGCVSTAKTVVSAPFKATGKIVDWSTTSQEEGDRNRGRMMRERDERLEKLNDQRAKAERKCRQGQASQCQRAEILGHEMDALVAQTI